MIYPDELSDSESAKVLEGFDIAESRHRIQQLDWRWWQTFRNKNQEARSEGTPLLTTTTSGRESREGKRGCFTVHMCVLCKSSLPQRTYFLCQKYSHCVSLKGLYSSPPRAPQALLLTAESPALQNSPVKSAKPETRLGARWPIPGLRLSVKGKDQSIPARNRRPLCSTASSILKGMTLAAQKGPQPIPAKKLVSISERQRLGLKFISLSLLSLTSSQDKQVEPPLISHTTPTSLHPSCS